MSRGFLIGAGWGTVVAGFGLVVASQVSDLEPVILETIPPAVNAANAPTSGTASTGDAVMASNDGVLPEIVPETEAVAELSDEEPVAPAGEMAMASPDDASPDMPQDSMAELAVKPTETEAAPAVAGQSEAPVTSTAPDVPSPDLLAEAPDASTESAAPPKVQTTLTTPNAPQQAAEAPALPRPDSLAPSLAGGVAALPDVVATDTPPTAGTPPVQAAEVVPEAVPEAVRDAETNIETEVATGAGTAAKTPPKILGQDQAEPALRPAPGFASRVVEGVKTGYLPSIGGPVVAETVTDVIVLDDPAAAPITRFAAPFENPDNKPLFAVLLYDTGGPDIDRESLAKMPVPVSFVIDPTLPDAAIAAQIYRAQGKEVLMLAAGIPAGATASDLAVSMEVTTAVLPEAVGVVDLENGGFRGNRTLATQALALIRDQGRGVMSWDQGLNAVSQVARREGMRSALIFRSLDNGDEAAPLIKRYLDRAAFKAAQDGRVVVAGKTRPETVAALLEWAVEGRAATMALAPATAVMTAQ